MVVRGGILQCMKRVGWTGWSDAKRMDLPSAAARSSLEIKSSFGAESSTGCFGWNCLSMGFSLCGIGDVKGSAMVNIV